MKPIQRPHATTAIHALSEIAPAALAGIGRSLNVSLGHGVSLFAGKVEALNTPTIRRLTPSHRHQLSPIAR